MGKPRNFSRQQVMDRQARVGRREAQDRGKAFGSVLAPGAQRETRQQPSKAEMRAQAEAAFRSFKRSQ